MKKIKYKRQQAATVINQKKLVNRNWKIFFAALSLVCMVNTVSAKNSVALDLSNENPLIRAANLNDVSAVKSLQKSSNVDYQDAKGCTALMHATRLANVEVMKQLLDPGKLNSVLKKSQKANPNIQNYNNQSPLMVAVSDDLSRNDHIELLLKYKANVNLQNEKGQTALMFAASKGRADRIALLIENGADVNIKDDNGQNALMYAAISGHEEVIPLLINAGVSQLKTGTAADPISQVKSVLKIIDERDNNDWTTLMHAVKNGHYKIVELLAKLKADPDCRDKNGKTALMIAVEQINLDSIKHLLKCHADPNIQDKDGKTALMIAVEQMNSDSVGHLLKYYANPNIQDKKGKTALMIATALALESSKKLLLIQHLTSAHSDVNIEDHSGNSAIMYMIDSDEEGNYYNMIIENLLRHNANPNVKKGLGLSGRTEFEGVDALGIAVMKGNASLVNLLLKYKTKLDGAYIFEDKEYNIIELAERELEKLQKSAPGTLVEEKTKNLKQIIRRLGYAITGKKKDIDGQFAKLKEMLAREKKRRTVSGEK